MTNIMSNTWHDSMNEAIETINDLCADCRSCFECPLHEHCIQIGGFLNASGPFVKGPSEELNIQIVSPIQIGTPVYFINVWGDKVEQGTVSMIQQKADKSWKFRISYKSGGSVFDLPVNDIGKSVFLTYDEAVKHLANNDVK